MTNQAIPAEAVEAAAMILDPQTMGSGGALAEKFKSETREEARRILEAAAPYMMAEAWDEGEAAGALNQVALDRNEDPELNNPYRAVK